MNFSKNGQGERNISPFSALATSLATTIGTGNIIGISTAIAIGRQLMLSGVFQPAFQRK